MSTQANLPNVSNFDPQLTSLPQIDWANLSPRFLESYCELRPDPALEEFLRRVSRANQARGWRLWLTKWLKSRISSYELQGWLGVHAMYLLGQAQAEALLGNSPTEALLDLGGGAGDVTQFLAPLFARTVVLDSSSSLVRRARARGREAHCGDASLDPWPDGTFQALALLNVLDRCARPRTLLERCARELRPGGRLLLSVPLPFRPHVEDGSRSPPPLEQLRVSGASWERQLTYLVEQVLAPRGFAVERWSRTPYLSAGDLNQPLYSLDAAVLVCRREPGG